MVKKKAIKIVKNTKNTSWEWLCNSKEAIEHQKNCKDTFTCDKCQWIDAASGSMEEYGTEVMIESEQHPLYNAVINTFGDSEIN